MTLSLLPYVLVQFNAGSTVEEMFSPMQSYTRHNLTGVQTTHNGVTLQVTPETSREAFLKAYADGLKRASKVRSPRRAIPSDEEFPLLSTLAKHFSPLQWFVEVGRNWGQPASSGDALISIQAAIKLHRRNGWTDENYNVALCREPGATVLFNQRWETILRLPMDREMILSFWRPAEPSE